MDEAWKLAGKRRALEIRARTVQAVRTFFLARDYLEVETPCLTPAPAPEPHIAAIACGPRFLQTSPELYMKRLLAAGYPRIFQICRCFRDGERGTHHLPEFTMLEWYRRDAGYRDLMTECEDLLTAVGHALGRGDTIPCGNGTISLRPPWERISVTEAFVRFSPMSLPESLAAGMFDQIMVDWIEPALNKEKPVFLYDYPLAAGSLARAKACDSMLVERFELYAGGMELANAFSELTDPVEQRRRFAEAREERRMAGLDAYPSPEEFLAALTLMPPAAGIALGVDRLAMLFADVPVIEGVIAFPRESG